MTATASAVLDLADWARPAKAPRRFPLGRMLGAVAALLAAAGAFALWQGHATWSRPAQLTGPALRIDLQRAKAVAAMTVDDQSQIMAEGNDAAARNAAIPFASGGAVPMGAFRLAAPALAANNALRCLTQAIYYEAATEPLPGRRAVAQVVLNRVRHPAYPKSVCGVVYQGSQLPTGCQFSFTCDGSLLRAPMARPWGEAEAIAREALAGRVEREVGTATHYHADYVLPRWAFEMAKIARLGRHLFYRFDGTWGRPGFFAGTYNPNEVVPALDFAKLRTRLLSGQALPGDDVALTPGLTVTPHLSDRHADNDVGGRIDTTRTWRLTIPDPDQASSRYRALVSEPASPASGTGSGPNPAPSNVEITP